MKSNLLIAGLLLCVPLCTGCNPDCKERKRPPALATIALLRPQLKSGLTLEQAISQRRSRRKFSTQPLSLAHISQLLWAAQGVTGKKYPFRSAPSAGALYPLELYAVVGNVTGMVSGIYHYQVSSHSLNLLDTGDKRETLFFAALKQNPVLSAPLTLVITAVFLRSSKKYGERGKKYSYMEAGHVGQNICLQAEALALATVPVGAFDEKQISGVLSLSCDETPLYLFPVGNAP